MFGSKVVLEQEYICMPASEYVYGSLWRKWEMQACVKLLVLGHDRNCKHTFIYHKRLTRAATELYGLSQLLCIKVNYLAP